MSNIKTFSLLASSLLLPVILSLSEMAHSATPSRSITTNDTVYNSASLPLPYQQLQPINNIQDLDKDLFNTVNYAIDTNIKAISLAYNNNYWGIQAPYKLSIARLKDFVTASRDINSKTQFVNSLSKDLISAVRTPPDWTKIKKNRDLVLGLMTDFLIYETLLQCQYNPRLAIALTLNLDKASEQKLYDFLYKSTYKQVCEQLLSNGMHNNEFIFKEDKFKEFTNEIPSKYFRHDWDCYLNQFKVIHSGVVANKNQKVWINSVLSTVSTLTNVKKQCAQRIKMLIPTATGSTEDLINSFETRSDLKRTLTLINKFIKCDVLKPNHNNIDYLIFLCNFCELQLSVNNKKLQSIDTVINIWQNLIKNVDKNLSRPPQYYLSDLRLIMSMAAISALDYKMEVNEQNIKNIINTFNQIQQFGIKLKGRGVDTFTGCHISISLLKYGIKTDTLLNEANSIKQKLPNIQFKTTCYLALLSCLAKTDSKFSTFGTAVDLYNSLNQMTENSIFTEQIIINCISSWKQGMLPDFIVKFNKIKCVFPNANSLGKYYKGNINNDILKSFQLYATTYGYKMGNTANYFLSSKFTNREEIINLLKGIDFNVTETNSRKTAIKSAVKGKVNTKTNKTKIQSHKLNSTGIFSKKMDLVEVTPAKTILGDSEENKNIKTKSTTSKVVSANMTHSNILNNKTKNKNGVNSNRTIQPGDIKLKNNNISIVDNKINNGKAVISDINDTTINVTNKAVITNPILPSFNTSKKVLNISDNATVIENNNINTTIMGTNKFSKITSIINKLNQKNIK